MSGKNPHPECGHGSGVCVGVDDPFACGFVVALLGFGYHEFGSSLDTPGDVASTKSHRRDSSTVKNSLDIKEFSVHQYIEKQNGRRNNSNYIHSPSHSSRDKTFGMTTYPSTWSCCLICRENGVLVERYGKSASCSNCST